MSLTQALKRSASALQRFKATTGQAESSVAKLGHTATSTGGAVGRIKSDVDKASGSLQDVQKDAKNAERSVGAAAKSMGTAGKTAATGGGLMGRMKTGLSGVTTGMKGLNATMKANAFGLLMTLLTPLIEKLVDMAMHSKTVQKIVQMAFRIIGQVISTTMKVAKQVVEATWNGIKKAFEVVLKVIWTVVKTYFTIYKTIITTVIHAILAVVRPMLDFFREKIPAAFNTVKNALYHAWGGLAGFARSAFSAVLGAVRGPINGVISLVNSAISALNQVHVTVPSWVPKLGGQSFGLHLPLIPMLAEGGIVLPRTGGTLALLAERGQAEAVMPLNRLEAMLTGNGRFAPQFAGPAGTARATGFHIEHYHEAPGASARRTAEDLMFLMKARG